jgi:transposase
LQAKAILASVRPVDVLDKTRCGLAAEQLADMVAVEAKIKSLGKALKLLVQESGSTLMELSGVGSIVADLGLADAGDVARSATETGSRPGPGSRRSRRATEVRRCRRTACGAASCP